MNGCPAQAAGQFLPRTGKIPRPKVRGGPASGYGTYWELIGGRKFGPMAASLAKIARNTHLGEDWAKTITLWEKLQD